MQRANARGICVPRRNGAIFASKPVRDVSGLTMPAGPPQMSHLGLVSWLPS
jgi:hypothetical protein